MVQIISISKARNNFSDLITQVAETKQPVIIVRESAPVAILHPYEETQNQKVYLQELLSLKTDWFTKEVEANYKKVRKELNRRTKRLKW